MNRLKVCFLHMIVENCDRYRQAQTSVVLSEQFLANLLSLVSGSLSRATSDRNLDISQRRKFCWRPAQPTLGPISEVIIGAYSIMLETLDSYGLWLTFDLVKIGLALKG